MGQPPPHHWHRSVWSTPAVGGLCHDDAVTTASLHEIQKLLGEPYYKNDDVLLYHGDCRKYLEVLKQGPQIPLTITSPPYNIGKEYEKPLELDAYLDWCESWLRDIWDVTAPDGALWLNLGYVPVPGQGKAIPLPYLLWNRLPFYVIQEVVWHYTAGVAARHSLSPRNEKLLWCVKDPKNYCFNLDAIRDPDVKYPNQKKNGRVKVNPLGKNPSDVWIIPKVTSGRASAERTAHPAQFPMALIERIMRGFSVEGDVVLDPFAGSGTVADVAMRTGRKSVGFELREDYLQFTVDRLERTRHDMAARLPLPVDGQELIVLDERREGGSLA